MTSSIVGSGFSVCHSATYRGSCSARPPKNNAGCRIGQATWPKPPDVRYHDDWPIRHPALFFGGRALHEPRYLALWQTLNPDPTIDEVIRNYPVRQPLLWVP